MPQLLHSVLVCVEPGVDCRQNLQKGLCLKFKESVCEMSEGLSEAIVEDLFDAIGVHVQTLRNVLFIFIHFRQVAFAITKELLIEEVVVKCRLDVGILEPSNCFQVTSQSLLQLVLVETAQHCRVILLLSPSSDQLNKVFRVLNYIINLFLC